MQAHRQQQQSEVIRETAHLLFGRLQQLRSGPFGVCVIAAATEHAHTVTIAAVYFAEASRIMSCDGRDF